MAAGGRVLDDSEVMQAVVAAKPRPLTPLDQICRWDMATL
jgi:hypothetical protein